MEGLTGQFFIFYMYLCYSWKMLTASVYLLFWCISVVTSDLDPTPQCQPRWLLFGQRCFAFFPVWSSWSTASTLCSQTGGSLMLLHTPGEMQIVLKLTNSSTPVWLRGYQNDSALRSNDCHSTSLTNHMDKKHKDCGTCMEMSPKSAWLQSTPCGELRFYICTTSPRFTSTDLDSRKLPQPGIVPGVVLFDVIWDSSSVQAKEIFHSSSLFRGLRSGNLTERCYSAFMQQEELYLQRVKVTLEVLIGSLHENNKIRSLLLNTSRQYRSTKQSLYPPSPPPKWLKWSLQSFHRVVLEDPMYWLVALSARACLHNFVAQRLQLDVGPQSPRPKENNLYWIWRRENENSAWIRSYKKLMGERQDQMDPFKAIDIFREHLMNQKSLHKAVNCQDEEIEEIDEIHGRAGVL